MTKACCTHPLAAIQAQMLTVDDMNLTATALSGIRALGISTETALGVVQKICDADFHKTMESKVIPGTFQDVYFPWFLGTKLYVKFGHWTQVGEYRVISFKENESGW